MFNAAMPLQLLHIYTYIYTSLKHTTRHVHVYDTNIILTQMWVLFRASKLSGLPWGYAFHRICLPLQVGTGYVAGSQGLRCRYGLLLDPKCFKKHCLGSTRWNHFFELLVVITPHCRLLSRLLLDIVTSRLEVERLGPRPTEAQRLGFMAHRAQRGHPAIAWDAFNDLWGDYIRIVLPHGVVMSNNNEYLFVDRDVRFWHGLDIGPFVVEHFVVFRCCDKLSSFERIIGDAEWRTTLRRHYEQRRQSILYF